jgi:hypothetical protein
MDKTKSSPARSRQRQQRRRFRDVSPSKAADAELRWFFNEAESAIDMPSNFQALIAGVTPPTSLEAVEQRQEAMHSARKVHDWLKRLRESDSLLLSGLYTERTWSAAVIRAFPGGLAGAAEASVRVRVEYVRALANAETRAKSVAEFIEEVVREGRSELVARWRDELEVACAIAIKAYERVRGHGPSVVPEGEG